MRHLFFSCDFRLFRCGGDGGTLAFDQARFFASGGIFVDDAFAHSRIQLDLGLSNFVERVGFAIINGVGCALDDRACLGFDQTVTRAAAGVFANFFLGGCRICQFTFLRMNNSDCDMRFYLKAPILQNQRERIQGSWGMVYNRRLHECHHKSRHDYPAPRHLDGDCDAVFCAQPRAGTGA